MSHCLTDEELDRLADGVLESVEAAPLLAHARACSSCHHLLEECKANSAFVHTLHEGMDDASTVIIDAREKGSVAGRVTVPQPDEIDGYLIQYELHRGMQGVICRGVRISDGRQVAVKFLREGPYATAATRKRFEREIDLARTLKHPNIIEIFDHGASRTGHQYYVMDFVDGKPLHRYVWDNKLSLRDTLELFVKVCGAVNHAHSRGVLHRDLKPSNILVDAAGEPKVLDFGLAKTTKEQADLTAVSLAGQVIGTLPYMSPEQARGDHDAVDIRTDVYALGVLLYRVLTGRYPYPVTGSLAQILHNIAHTAPLPPGRAGGQAADLNPVERSAEASGPDHSIRIAGDVETIILKALAKEPERRYQNVAFIEEDLKRFLAGQPIEARRDAGIRVLSKSLARYKVAVYVACASLALIAIFAGTIWNLYQAQTRATQEARSERRAAIVAQDRLASVLLDFGDHAAQREDYQDALGHYKASLALNKHLASVDMQALRYQWNISEVYLRLGDLALATGDLDRAEDNYRRFNDAISQLSNGVPQHRGYQDRMALSFERLAHVAVLAGEQDRARDYGTQALAIRRRLAEEPRATAAMIGSYAWLMLTVEPQELRNPAEALRRALQAVDMGSREGSREDPELIATLALAFDRAGRIDAVPELRTLARDRLPADSERLQELIMISERRAIERPLHRGGPGQVPAPELQS